MTFTWPTFLWVLLLVPGFIGVWWALSRRRERTAQVFADGHLLSSVVRTPPKAHVRWPLGLQLTAMTLLLLAASRPVAAPILPANKAAVIIAVDTSKSMQAADLNPSRLEAAKAVAREFLKVAPPSTQIGLVSFSDNASVLVFPTTDRQKVLEAIERLKPSQNTSIASAVVTGVRALPGRKDLKPPKALLPPNLADNDPLQAQPDLPQALNPEAFPPGSIMILSDGASNVSTNPTLSTQGVLDIAARFAKDNKVKIYTFPLGREGGAVTNLGGQSYYIPFEPKPLQALAQNTGGKSVYPPSDEALRAVFKELGTVIRWEPTRLEISALLSGLAVLLMLIGAGLNLHWQRKVP
ncbi:MAG: VWA domain-containing protein [Thermaceae bacterium]|nr:VWA domain-containing protein [Thermaceae bacterium]